MRLEHCLQIAFALCATQIAVGQHVVPLESRDAVQIAETSDLFKSHYVRGGCPQATASIGATPTEIALRMEDGCLGGVSAFAGDYVVDRWTGTIRDALDHQIILKSSDPAVAQVWNELEHSLLNEQEAYCEVWQTPKVRTWQALSIPITKGIRSDRDFFDITVTAATADPSVSERVLRFRVNRRDYRLFEGRFLREDLSDPVLAFRKTLVASKQPIELSAEDILLGVRGIPEVASWLSAEHCRRILLQQDLEGATYYSLSGVRWCSGEKVTTEIGLAVDKRSGQILAPQGIDIQVTTLPDVGRQLKKLAEQRAAAQSQVKSCAPR